jgi:glyoxylase-like metal-dependent hydrolase (beta-lactamase superfamily II)
MAQKWGVVGFRDPEAALSQLGWTPRDVTDVIVTHTHWDHVGGLSLFSHARLWISKEALRGIPAKGPGLPGLVRDARRDKRLEAMESLQKVLPGVLVVTTGLHAPGSSYVVVRGKQNPWVFASDEAPLWANFEKKRPTGQSKDRKKSLELQTVMLKLVEQDLSKIVPGHEPKIFEGNPFVRLE